MSSLHFIVNPISGSGMGKRRFELVRKILDEKNAQYTFEYTQHPNHGVELAKNAVAAGHTTIVAAGGDGTLNEVASVVKDHPHITLGLLPFGTGNDFAGALGLPNDEDKLVAIILAGNAVPVDAGMAGESFFMNVAGFGFDVDVVRYTENFKRKLNGMLPYMLGILKSLIYLSRTVADIETDSGEHMHISCILLSACNGCRFAGGIKLAPLASPRDGLLDVCILKSVNRLKFLYLLPKYMQGKHLGYKDFLYFKAKSIVVNTAANMPMECDGEIMGTTPAVFRALPGAINFLVGKEWAEESLNQKI